MTAPTATIFPQPLLEEADGAVGSEAGAAVTAGSGRSDSAGRLAVCGSAEGFARFPQVAQKTMPSSSFAPQCVQKDIDQPPPFCVAHPPGDCVLP